MPSPITYTCSVVGSDWTRVVTSQSAGVAARLFAQDVRLPEWRVVRLRWTVPSGVYKGQPREADYLWAEGSVSRYRWRPNSPHDETRLPEPAPKGARP